MKKITTLMLLLAMSLMANAQELTAKQVMGKAFKALKVSEGITGNVSLKSLGIGETVKFATDGNMGYTSTGEELEWFNDGIDYTVNTKDKTLTMEDDEGGIAMLLMPYAIAGVAVMDEGDLNDMKNTKAIEKMKEIVTDVTMTKSKSEYEIDFKIDGQKAELYVDRQTYHIKCMKIKKGIITLLSINYSNLKKLTDHSILKFDKSKYVGYKVIDERGKTKTTKTTNKKKK